MLNGTELFALSNPVALASTQHDFMRSSKPLRVIEFVIVYHHLGHRLEHLDSSARKIYVAI